MNDTERLHLLAACAVMIAFILIWLIDGGTVVTFIGALFGLGALVWLAWLGVEEEE